MRHAFTVDVEDYYQVSAFERVVAREAWSSFPSRVEANTQRLIDLLERHRTKATFFILGWVAERHPELVKDIDRCGHELACHGYSHRLIYTQTPREFAQETRRAKDVLEQIAGKAIRGYRAASYSITRKSLWALDTLIELGFRYDSSIFPVRHDRYGIPGAPRFPYLIERRPGRSIVEFPVSTLDIGGYRLPVGGGGYFRIFPYWLSTAAISRLDQRERQPAMFYVHPWELDPDQPRIRASLLSRFRHYCNLHKCAQRLELLLDSTRFDKVTTVLDEYPYPLPRMSLEGTSVGLQPSAGRPASSSGDDLTTEVSG